MMLLDYLICNQDRHFGNFGAIRDAVTLEWVGFAPIFDSGTSLWFDQYASKIKALADAPAKPFAATQQAQLALAKDGLQTLNLSALNGCKDEVLAIFEQAHADCRKRHCSPLQAFFDSLKLPRLLSAGVKEGENTSLHDAFYCTMQTAK